MLNSNRFGTQVQAQSWRDTVKELRNLNDEAIQYQSLMTPYEKALVRDAIKARCDQVSGRAQGAAIAEFQTAIGNYQGKQKAYEKALAKENASWDYVKLQAERNAIQQMVEGLIQSSKGNLLAKPAPLQGRLEQLYQEAANGDNTRKRAVAEVFMALSSAPIPADHRVGLGTLIQQAKDDVRNLRFTDELVDATVDTQDAVKTIEQLKGELEEAAGLFGWSHDVMRGGLDGPIGAVLRRVRPDANGNLTILEVDDPKVTGIKWPGGKAPEFITGGEVGNV